MFKITIYWVNQKISTENYMMESSIITFPTLMEGEGNIVKSPSLHTLKRVKGDTMFLIY